MIHVGTAVVLKHSDSDINNLHFIAFFLQLGLKPVPGIHRVTIRKAKNILFIIQRPEVRINFYDIFWLFLFFF